MLLMIDNQHRRSHSLATPVFATYTLLKSMGYGISSVNKHGT